MAGDIISRKRNLTEVELAQRRANVEKIAAKRRAETHCRHGHLLILDTKRRQRYCPTCRSDAAAHWRAIQKARLAANPNERRHGTANGYQLGCRCFRCRLASHEKKAKEWREQKCSSA